MNTSWNHSNSSFHSEREKDRDTDGGGYHNGNILGSSPGNNSAQTSSFYNLQMYSTPRLYNTAPAAPMHTYSKQPQSASFNLYRNVQEVLYHPSVDHGMHHQPVRSTPSPSASSSTEFNNNNIVHKNGITFVDPFSTSTTNSMHNHNNNSNTMNVNTSNRINSETIIQPIYTTFGTESIFVTCPYCHNTDSTDIEQVIGSEALFWACIIPFAGFLLKSKRDTRHRCKNCLNVIGTYYP